MKTWLVLGLAACGLAACGKSVPNSIPDPRPLDLAAINALVPDSLKADLVFEATQLDVWGDDTRETFTVATPKGWTGDRASPLMVKLEPPAGKLGRYTLLRVALGGGGKDDKPQDWDAVSRKREFNKPKLITIERDEDSPTDHLLVDTDGTRHITYAWWRPGGLHYYTCEVTLNGPVGAAEAAFERACKSITIASNGRPIPDWNAPPTAPIR